MHWLRDKKNIMLVTILSLLTFASIGLVTKDRSGKVVNNILIQIENQFDNYYLDNEDITRLLTDNGNRQIQGAFLSDMSLRTIERELLNEKFIKKAEIYHDLKGSLTVSVELRRPVARILQSNGPDAYVDADGTILPVSEDFTSRVILISGNKAGSLITEGFANENQSYFELLTYIHSDPFWRAQIAQMNIDKRGEVTFYPQVTKQKILFGHPEDLETKFRKLKVFYKEILPVKSWNHYKKVDLRFENQIVCQ